MSESSDLMTAEEVAALLRVSRASVYRWGEDGTLDAIRIGGVVRFKRGEVLHLLEKPEDGAA